MRRIILAYVLLFAGMLTVGCTSETSYRVELEDPPEMEESQPPPPPQPPSKQAAIRPSFRKAVLEMLKKYSPVHPDTFEIIPAGEYFSLLQPEKIFSQQEMNFFIQGESVRVRLRPATGEYEIVMEERILLSTQDVDKIVASMSRPVSDLREERFLKRPFTFWQFENAVCHLFTSEEPYRKEMDRVYEEWVRIQSPEQ